MRFALCKVKEMDMKLTCFSEEYNLEDLIENLKTINEFNSKTLAFTELYEHQFFLFDPADGLDVDRLQKSFSYPIPHDFIQFLICRSEQFVLQTNKSLTFYPSNRKQAMLFMDGIEVLQSADDCEHHLHPTSNRCGPIFLKSA